MVWLRELVGLVVSRHEEEVSNQGVWHGEAAVDPELWELVGLVQQWPTLKGLEVSELESLQQRLILEEELVRVLAATRGQLLISEQELQV